MFNKRSLELLIQDPNLQYIAFGVDVRLCLNLSCIKFITIYSVSLKICLGADNWTEITPLLLVVVFEP